MDTITIELTEFKTVSDSVAWKADILELTDPPSIGIGDSKETALASLFLRVGSYTPFSQHETLKYTTDVKIVEIPLQEPTNQPAAAEFVVPEYVVHCINALNLENLSDYAAIGISRVLTMTAAVSHRGIFTNSPKNVEFQLLDGTKVCVDFSNLPLFPYQFKYTLTQRCQRVGQAILDAQNKPKPIDPDKGLPDWDVINKAVMNMNWDPGVYGELGERYSFESSRLFTGTSGESNGNGIFGDSCSYPNNIQFMVEVSGLELQFEVNFAVCLCTENIKTEIPNRIRLVREARAKALQEAGFSG